MTPLQLEIQLKNFSENPNDENRAALDQSFQKLSLSTLNDFCLSHENVRTLLGQSVFLSFWQEQMAGIKVKNLPDFKFKITESLHPMEITLGYFNYLQSLRYPNDVTKFINQALSFHSFHALEAFSQELIINFAANNEESCSLISSAIDFFEQEAPWHGTPAYLLVAKLYFRWALALTERNTELVSTAYFMALKNLELAKLLETESANDLNNAYFGRSLADNNPFKLSSIEDMRIACINEAGDYIETADIARATQSVRSQKSTRMKTKRNAPEALSELNLAILADSTHVLKVLCKQSELERKNVWGETPLLFAIRHNKMDSIRCLLSLGANPTQVDSKRISAFRLALETKQLGIARLLLNKAPHLIEQYSSFPITKSNVRESLDALNKIPTENELNALEDAILKNQNPTIEQLLTNGLSPDLILSSGKTGLTQLLSVGNNEGVALLLKHGASLSLQDDQGETILFSLMNLFSSKKEKREIKYYFHYFSAIGADINAQNNIGETLLIQAIKRGDTDAVAFLLHQDHIDLKKQTKEGLSALDYAKKHQYPYFVSLLNGQRTTLLQQTSSATDTILSFFGLKSHSSKSSKEASRSLQTTAVR